MPLKTNFATWTLVLIFYNIISYFYKVQLVSILTKSLAYFFLIPCLYFSNSYSSQNFRLSELSIFYLSIPSALIVLFNREASRVRILVQQHIELLEEIQPKLISNSATYIIQDYIFLERESAKRDQQSLLALIREYIRAKLQIETSY